MVVQGKQRVLEVDQQSDDDFVEACELIAQEFVNDEVHTGERDEAAQKWEVPAGNEYLYLHLLP